MKLIEKIQKLTIEENRSILDAIKQMDALIKKILIVTVKGEYKSIITIGDIQRHLILHQDFDALVKNALREVTKVRVSNMGTTLEENKKMI